MKGALKRRSRPGAVLLSVFLFLSGAAVFFYPTVSNYFAQREQLSVIRNYQEQTDGKIQDALELEWRKAEEYNESLAGDPLHDPFVPGSGYALPENYWEVLNVDGVMGYVEIPRIGVRLPIYHGTSDEVLEKGVGHIESTALPIGGNFRHTVLSGHRGLPRAELFTRLDELKAGDMFYIHVLGKILAYEVDQIRKVLPTDLEEVQALPDRDLVTLLTCTPYGVNTHRLLVRGSRTEYVPDEEGDRVSAPKPTFCITLRLSEAGLALGVCLLLTVVVLLLAGRGRHGKKR